MRFGILGDAKIAREKLRPAIEAAGHKITHIGRRDPSQGADDIWGDVTTLTYDELFAHPDIDAIYNPLPNHLHVPMSIKALKAGKPVLSEKPVALSLEELDQLEQAAKDSQLYVYDGYMIRYHPQWKWISELDIGERKIINAHFCYPPQPTGNVRNKAEFGGGPVWDIGCYCMLSALLLFDGTPELMGVVKEAEAHLDVEKTASAVVHFGHGQMLNFSVSSGTALAQSMTVIGTDGWASLDVPYNPPAITKARFAKQVDGPALLLTTGNEITFEPCDQYQLMVEDFAKAVAEKRQADFTQSRHITRILQQIVDA